MTGTLDPARLPALERELGLPASRIAAILVAELSGALAQLESALAARRREDAADAAHRARNSALLLGDADLLNALRELEDAARAGELNSARAAHAALSAAWEPLCRELETAGRSV